MFDQLSERFLEPFIFNIQRSNWIDYEVTLKSSNEDSGVAIFIHENLIFEFIFNTSFSIKKTTNILSHIFMYNISNNDCSKL